MSAVYNKQWFFVSFPCLSYILTYLPTTYLLEDIYVFNVVTYSVITSALAFSYLVTCNNLCKKFYQNDNVTCQFYQNTWIILVEIYTFVELFVNRMPFFIILSHFEITFSKLKSVQVMVRLHIFPIFSFLAKMLSFLCQQTITWTDFRFKIRVNFTILLCF